MKKLITATLVLLAIAGSASASDAWKHHYKTEWDRGGVNGASSTITINGLYGNDVSQGRFSTHGLEYSDATIVDRTVDHHETDTRYGLSTLYDSDDRQRDWVEYVVTNGDRTFTVAEVNSIKEDGEFADKDKIIDCRKTGRNCTTYIKQGKVQWANYLTYSNVEDRRWDEEIVIESNFNSYRFWHDVQGFKSGNNRRHEGNGFIGDVNVNDVDMNEAAKQIVATTVALTFDKFKTLSSRDMRRILYDNMKQDDQRYEFNQHTVDAVLSPYGTMK